MPCKDDFSRGIQQRKSRLTNERLEEEAYIENYSSSYKSPNSAEEKEIQPTKRKNKNERNQSKNRSRKRKMSATPPARLLCQREDLQNNIIREENEDEIDVTQSLFTLQLSNRLNFRKKQSRNEIDKFIMPSFNKKDSKPIKRINQISSNAKRVGYHQFQSLKIAKQFNPKDSIFRKISNYASDGGGCEENRSEFEVDKNIIDITKAQKGNQSDKDDGSQAGSDEDESVSLEDQNLNELEILIFKYPSLSYIKINSMLLLEIQLAENGSEIMQTMNQQPEEYESLVWGQSIWSTDVPKESKLQFMANLQQMQNTSDINTHAGNGSGITNKIDKITPINIENIDNIDKVQENNGVMDNAFMNIKNDEIQNQKIDMVQKPNQIHQNRQQVIEERVPYHHYHRHNHHYSISPSKTDIMARNNHYQHHNQQKMMFELHSSHQQHHQNQFFDKNNQFNQLDHDRKFHQQKMIAHFGYYHHQQNDEDSLYFNQQQHQNYSNMKSNQIYSRRETQFDHFQNVSNDYKQMKQESMRQYDHSNISNHSSTPQQMNFGGDYKRMNKSVMKIKQYEIGTEYPKDDSSNYTHHPYSQYEGNLDIQQKDEQNLANDIIHQSDHHHNNQQNRPYMFINRQMNRYLMNPIFKSKQTIQSLQMHRYSGIPWRGGSHRDIAHGLGSQLNINSTTNQPLDQSTPHIQSIQALPENSFQDFYHLNQNQTHSLQLNHDASPYFGQNIMDFNKKKDKTNIQNLASTEILSNPFVNIPSIDKKFQQSSFINQNSQNKDQYHLLPEMNKNQNYNIENLEFIQTQNFDLNKIEKTDNQTNINQKEILGDQIQQESQNETLDSQTLKQISINAPPFYPKNDFEVKNQGFQIQNDNQKNIDNFLPVGNHIQANTAFSFNNQTQNQSGGNKILGTMLNNMHHKQKQTQAIHVPIPIPIMNRNIGLKAKNQLPQQSKIDCNDQIGQQKLSQNQIQNQNTSASLIFNTFYGGEILSKKNELDQKMKETTQNLELKINKAVEIDNEDDDQFSEDNDFTFENHSFHDPSEFNSVERPSSSLNILNDPLKYNLNFPNSMSQVNLIKNSQDGQIQQNQEQISMNNQKNYFNSNKNSIENQNKQQQDKIKHYEEKVKRRNDRATIFKKLQDQLNQFKIEMFQTSSDQQLLNSPNRVQSCSKSPKRVQPQNIIKQNSEQSQQKTSADEKGIMQKNQQKLGDKKLTPFRQDAKLYLDKVLNLMNMVNEVDDVTNVANLKNMLEKKKLLLLKARAERDQFSSMMNKQILENQQLQQLLKENQFNQEKQQADFQSLIANINEQNQRQVNDQIIFYDHQIFELRKQIDLLNQENHNLVNQNSQYQEKLNENINFYSQQISQLNSQITELKNSVFQQNNQIQLQLQQIDQENQNICLLQQNLNQSKMEQQILQQKVDSSKQTNANLERQLKDSQKQLHQLQQQKSQSNLKKYQNQKNVKKSFQKEEQSESQISQVDQQDELKSSANEKNDIQNIKTEHDDSIKFNIKERSRSVSSKDSNIQKKDDQIIDSEEQIELSSHLSSNNSNDSLTLDEKLENANQQIKDLQNYIKKRSLDDIKNNQLKVEQQTKIEKIHQEQIEEIKKQMKQMENEKNTIIQNLKDQIKNQRVQVINESQKRDYYDENKNLTPSKLKFINKQDSINDQSIIEPRSEDSFDKYENTDDVREIIYNTQCEQCCEKEKIIRQNEQKISEYIEQIKLYQSQQIKIDEIDLEQNQEVKDIVSFDNQQSENFKNQLTNIHRDFSSNIQSLHSILNSSQQILLNNFIRQIKHYLGGIGHNHAVDMQYKMKVVLGKLESTQRITLLEEDELDEDFKGSNFSKENMEIRLETKQKLIAMSLDLLNELLILSTKLQTQLIQKQKEVISAKSSDDKSSKSQDQKIIEKVIEKTIIQFKTIDFGMNSVELKQMQAIAKDERKACHHIIVEIEKLMYEMNSVLAGAHGQMNQVQINKLAQNVFGQILDTYLLLPHRLKPIFDHCKKIETIISKAFKQQDQILKQSQLSQSIQK